MYQKKRKFFKYILILLTNVFLLSCASKKNVLYFQDSDKINYKKLNYTDAKIQPNDIINIKISALNSESVKPYNIDNKVAPNTSFIEILKLQGYLVSQEGSIIFPVIGKIKVSDKTTSELENHIKKILIDGGHVIDPAVSVRILNSKVTILGDVQKPGTYTFTENKITLLQALGYAGDLTINGSRKDILVIREVSGMQITKRIDLTTTDWFDSDFYFVKQNDVIIVNPNLNKIKSSGLFGSASSVMSAISLLLTAVLIITR